MKMRYGVSENIIYSCRFTERYCFDLYRLWCKKQSTWCLFVSERVNVYWHLLQRWKRPKLYSCFCTKYFKNCPWVRREVVRESGDMTPLILNFGVNGGEWSALYAWRFASGKERGRHWTWGIVGPVVSADAVEQRKISRSQRKFVESEVSQVSGKWRYRANK
jgi:hypothetical protein